MDYIGYNKWYQKCVRLRRGSRKTVLHTSIDVNTKEKGILFLEAGNRSQQKGNLLGVSIWILKPMNEIFPIGTSSQLALKKNQMDLSIKGFFWVFWIFNQINKIFAVVRAWGISWIFWILNQINKSQTIKLNILYCWTHFIEVSVLLDVLSFSN